MVVTLSLGLQYVCARCSIQYLKVCAHLKMALFNRSNLNAFWLLNHCYCKFTTSGVKLKSLEHSTSSNFVKYKFKQNEVKTTKVLESKNKTFEIELANRRDQACRSILVQIYSLNSCNDLSNYCAQFGEILSMHHYRKGSQHNYILIEFKDLTSVNDIQSSASFMNTDLIAPVESSVLWFRKGITTIPIKQKQKFLVTQNGCTYPTEMEISNLLYNAKTISGQLIELYKVLKLDDLESRLRFHTAYHLEQYFSRLLRNIKVLPFGSSINGFGWKKCDLDLVVVSENIEESNIANRLIFHAKRMQLSERHETKEFMGIIASAMQYFVPGINNVRKILQARVPIIKFIYEYTHIECDLSTTNMSAVYMSELLNFYGEIDWRVRPLVIAVRKWAKSQHITSDLPGQWITNFSLSLLVLFYLQQRNILPSLKLLKSRATNEDIRYTKNGIDCTFLRDITKLPSEYKYKLNQDSLETLLYNFFEYYSKFDFHVNGICIREGVQIQKPSNSALHITNPFETTLNVCKNVTSNEVNRIAQKIHDALCILETADKACTGNSWGLMNLLGIKTNSTVQEILKLKNAREKNIKDCSEDYFHENSDKIQVNEVDNNQPKKKKEMIP